MKERELKVPYVSLSRNDMDRIVGRFDAVAQEADDKERSAIAEHVDKLGTYKSAVEREAAIDERMQRRFRRPRITLTTRDGRERGNDWDAMLAELEVTDIRSITMFAKSERIEVEAIFALAGLAAVQDGSSRIDVTAESSDELRKELAFYREIFDRRRSRIRGFLGHWITTFVASVAFGIAAVFGAATALSLLGVTRSDAAGLAVIVGFVGGTLCVLLIWQLTPRVRIEGIGPTDKIAGPTLWLAGILGTLFLGVVASLIASLIVD